MRFRHKRIFQPALALAIAAASTAPVLADDTVSLARVARELGFSYRYLAYENAVALQRPGATIVVRPGDGFFSANERREPVYGIVPVYRHNDVYVSRAFVDEIRDLGRVPGGRSASGPIEVLAVVPPRPAPAQAPSGKVSRLEAAYDSATDAIVVRGRATPGSRVALAVRATLSEILPVVTVERASTYAAADGTFAVRLGFGSDNFQESRYVVEATGESDARAMTATVPTRTPAATQRTAADDRR